ncbi:CPBP family intramembrane glutamic endopeptidase [Phocaeicola sp.]
MGRAIKLVLYYFAYQLLFLFLATGIDAIITVASGTEITINFKPGAMAISLGMIVSALVMTWHLIHFHYVKFGKESIHETSTKIILLSIPLLLSAQFISGVLNESLGLSDINQDLFLSMSHNFFGFLSIALIIPILEELLFRGAIEGNLLKKGWKPKWAILVSALIFGLVHGNPAQIPFAFLIGLLFGWLYYRTGSVIPGIVGHVINNTFGAVTMLTSTKEEMSKTTMETLGTTPTYLLLALALIVFAVMIRIMDKNLPATAPQIGITDERN